MGGSKFWLQFALNEALDVLTAYGATVTQDATLAQKMQAASAAIKDCVGYLLQSQVK